MTDKTYNGWANYETWATNLHMSNDQTDQEYWDEQAKRYYNSAKEDKPFTKAENATYALSQEIESVFKENAPELQGVYADLLTAALSEINWHEIAKYLIDAAIEESKNKSNQGGTK